MKIESFWRPNKMAYVQCRLKQGLVVCVFLRQLHCIKVLKKEIFNLLTLCDALVLSLVPAL